MSSPRQGFWQEALALQGSATPQVAGEVILSGFYAAIVVVVELIGESNWGWKLGLEVAPFEIAGAALGLLLILRTNAGYDRWWEARKLWGGIVNQSRNLVISALSYGPTDPRWREKFVRWAAVFPHVARCSLRGERPCEAVADLVGREHAARIAASGHMPGYVASQLANLLSKALEEHNMDRFAFMQIDKERATLIDHIGACERILKTPLPIAYSIKIRRFIMLFLITLPFALLHRMSTEWLVPVITMLVAYPVLSLDQIGVELEQPFASDRLNSLPLDEISVAIEMNVQGYLKNESATEVARIPI